jgi:signal recognition particle subunit SRP54
MFDALSEKLQSTLSAIRGHGVLTERDVASAMREIRLALLEADVNFKVAKEFVDAVRERALGAEVAGQLNPGQTVVKIVHEELTAMMGGPESPGIAFASRPPTVILIAGLQGSGKTTAAAKLAALLTKEYGSSVALAACDTQRPAAVEQLVVLGERAGATVYERGTQESPVEIARWALGRARTAGKDVLIVDTAGRLHVDAALMDELRAVADATKPDQTLLVLDAMTGQDAVNVAEQFAAAVRLDGIVLTKLDGDARGGAALSVRAVTGSPIMFASSGERLDAFERFHADRLAARILGMGDVLTLIEKAGREVDESDAKELEKRLRAGEFDLEDFLGQLRAMRRMGPLQGLLGMLPGVGAQLRGMRVDEREFDRIEAIILAMTPAERRRPELIKGSRRLRIARGSGTNVQAVNQLVKQFAQVRTVMRKIGKGGRVPDLGALMRQQR